MRQHGRMSCRPVYLTDEPRRPLIVIVSDAVTPFIDGQHVTLTCRAGRRPATRLTWMRKLPGHLTWLQLQNDSVTTTTDDVADSGMSSAAWSWHSVLVITELFTVAWRRTVTSRKLQPATRFEFSVRNISITESFIKHAVMYISLFGLVFRWDQTAQLWS